jgi:hypothetical protein
MSHTVGDAVGEAQLGRVHQALLDRQRRDEVVVLVHKPAGHSADVSPARPGPRT